MNNLILIGIGILALVIVGLVIYFKRRSVIKKIIKTGKILGASEARDEIRLRTINIASKQIEESKKIVANNKEIITRSNDAIEKARAVREKASTNITN